MRIETYLFFEGRCEEAIDFYRRVLGAETTMMMRYSESPDAPPPDKVPPGMDDKIMHASLRIGDRELMASDGNCSGKANFGGFSLTVSMADESTADRVFAELSDGGQVTMPLERTFFSPKFGMLTDRFGVGWMVMVEAGAPQ